MAQWGAAFVLAFVVLSGCLGGSKPDDAVVQYDLQPLPRPSDLAPLVLRGEGCSEGGGHSVHPRFLNPLPEPWVPADILEDVGPQLLYSEVPDPTSPVPSEGNTIGNYHATFACERWWLNGVERPAGLVLGFVGMKVESPPFDAEPAPTRSYLITVLAAADEELLHLLTTAGFHAVPASGVIETVAGAQRHTLLDTDGHGVYESYFVPKEMGAMTPGPVRLWWQHEVMSEGYRPIALDFANVDGVHYAAQGQGTFTHTETRDHDPVPGAGGQTAALLYEGFDRSVSWGPRPDVTLEAAYIHA